MPDMNQLAAEIAAAGIDRVFGITGSGASLLLCDRLEACGVDVVRTMVEGSAAIMAGTVGRVTGTPGAALAIKGPGVANMAPGLAVCAYEAFPMLALCEAYPPGAPAAKAHKRLDHAAFLGPVTKAVRPLAERGPGVAEAVACAVDEVPGPVVLELAGGGVPDQPALPVAAAPPANAGVIDRIAAASRPVVIAGTLAIRAGWGEALSRLAVPVFSTAAAKGVIDEALPMAANVYTGVGLEHTPEARLLAEADLVIGLGLRPGEVLATKPFACPAVNVEAVADVAGVDGFAFEAVAAAGQAPDVFRALADKAWGLDALGRIQADLDGVMADGFLPGRVFDLIQSHFNRVARLVLDTGYFCTIGEHAIRAACADLCLMSGQARYMGTVLPMAIGAAFADPSRPTVAVVGDGGIGMGISEIRLAVEHRLPLLVVLMSDGRFGSIATRAIQDGLTQRPLTPAQPSWLAVMEGFGLPGARVEDEEALCRALRAWTPSGGPAYLEVGFAPDPYERMIAGIR